MKRHAIFFTAAAAALILTALWYMQAGSVRISLSDVLSALTGQSSDSTKAAVVMQLRLPRMLSAIILGGALSLSGYLLQAFFGNPIAGPYVLGISGGAKLFVALFMIGFLSEGLVISSAVMICAAFAGSLIAMGFVLLLSAKVRSMSVLVVCGVMIGYICSAITDIVVTFADDSNIVNLHNWSQGSFSGTSWENVRIMAVITALCFAASFLLSKPVSAYQLGEPYAQSMGVNIRLLRVLLILLSSLLSACVTAFAGPISFVGMAVPHLARTFLQTDRPLILIPGCFIFGSAATLLCDGIARCLFAPTEISISSVTAVIFVPVVIVMLLQNAKERRM